MGRLSKSDIPQAVLHEASWLIEEYGCAFTKIGQYDGKIVYLYCFPDNTETGYPVVYLYDEMNMISLQVTGENALDIINDVNKE